MRQKLYLFVLFLFINSVHAEERFRESFPSSSLASRDGLVSTLVDGCVCAITGEFVDSQTDLIIPGPQPLILKRSYSSGDISESYLYRGWQLSHPTELIIEKKAIPKPDENFSWVYFGIVAQPSGAKLAYKELSHSHAKKDQFPLLLEPVKGLTNCGISPSAKSNLKQQIVYYDKKSKNCTVYDGGGEERYFKYASKLDGIVYFNQIYDRKINGNKFFYRYDKYDNLLQMYATNRHENTVYSSLNFDHTSKKLPNGKKGKLIRVTSSDGREINYQFTDCSFIDKELATIKSRYLTRVDRSDGPWEAYSYSKKSGKPYLQVELKSGPNQRYKLIQYYGKGWNSIDYDNIVIHSPDDWQLNRVKMLFAPVGPDATPIATHRFRYHLFSELKNGVLEPTNGVTDVYDANYNKTTYFFDKDHRLTALERCKGNFRASLEGYFWQDHFLKGKYLQNEYGQTLYGRYFDYDQRGNIVTEGFYGQLTGTCTSSLNIVNQYPVGGECYGKYYTYTQDACSLLIHEKEDNGKQIHYAYKPGTDLVNMKLLADGQNSIILRQFYEYDENGSLTKSTLDDGSTIDPNNLTGVSQRKIIRYTLRTTAPNYLGGVRYPEPWELPK